MTQYIVLMGQIVGGNGRPFEVLYGYDGRRFKDRKKAIAHGLEKRESDDFNIGVLKRGKLVSLDWMDKPLDTDADDLQRIQDQISPL